LPDGHGRVVTGSASTRFRDAMPFQEISLREVGPEQSHGESQRCVADPDAATLERVLRACRAWAIAHRSTAGRK
jgi:hypothetical protein